MEKWIYETVTYSYDNILILEISIDNFFSTPNHSDFYFDFEFLLKNRLYCCWESISYWFALDFDFSLQKYYQDVLENPSIC